MICPMCKKEFDGKMGDKYFPFCCERCQLVDLYGWMNEEYVISEPAPMFQEEEDE